MQGGERHLGGPGEVQVVLGQVVDLLLGVGQHPGPQQRRGLDEHRGDDRLEAGGGELGQRVLHEGELEHHEVPAQVREPGARHASGPLGVDPPAGELEVVAAARAGLPDLAQDGVLGRSGVGWEVGSDSSA